MAIKTSKSKEGYFSKYQSSKQQEQNRKHKLEKQAEKQPNNLQIPLALKNVRYRRHIPHNPYWSHQMIGVAKLFKQFLGRFDKQYFSTDPKISMASMVQKQTVFSQCKKMPLPKYSMFSIQARINSKENPPEWI